MQDDIYILIPSRISSTRLVNKPLVDLNGKTLIQRVFKNALEITTNSYVATDSELIKENLKSISSKIIMTSPDHLSGTDRIFEAAKKINIQDDSFILNLQGDEPFIPKKLINQVIEDYSKNKCDVITVSTNIRSEEDILNPNCVLVDVDKSNYAINFGRTGDFTNTRRHIGIYGYSFKILKKITELEPTKNELAYKLEQLRFLENKYSIYVSHYNENIPHGIDTKEDISNAIKFLNKK
ncbi:MAG: 3-deoxy-manno-octulosonate cytidylyltransferase [Gammaproteobacteria bacterium]|nr:3-deoxy-manno-octulosonate cytidylyltransferase [Gammaproteobacteria bacterium]|tara:strand:+ start:209 stop:922 length:714 start_codon:yes stop_codon:yes gene_type:complete